MPQMHKIFPPLAAVFALCACLATGAAGTSPQLGGDRGSFDSGVAAYDAGDYQKAFKIWWDLRYEDLAAMRNVAMMLRKGQGMARDPKQAEELYLRAAEAGLPTAQADLADMLLKGEAGAARPGARPAAAGGRGRRQSSRRAISVGPILRDRRAAWCPRTWKPRGNFMPPPPSHGMPEAAERSAFLGPPAVEQSQTAGAPAAAAPAAAQMPPDLRTKPLN